MSPVNNVGGSITGAVFLTLAALGVRLLLRRPAHRHANEHNNLSVPDITPRFLGRISMAALQLLVETHAVAHVVVQVHETNEAPPLPGNIAPHSVSLTPAASAQVLQGPVQQWEQHTLRKQGSAVTSSSSSNGLQDVRRAELICIVSYTAAAAHKAACALAANGFGRVTITIAGQAPDRQTQQKATGTQQVEKGASMHEPHEQLPAPGYAPETAATSRAADVQYLSRDALAVLQGQGQQRFEVPHVLLDVRRHDERALYGLLWGSQHVPVTELPSALACSAEEFQTRYRFPKPQPGTPLIIYSRTSRRASWAAQLCGDAGLWPVYVYRHGTYGWRMDQSVKPYKQYYVGDAPPEPETFQVEPFDEVQGIKQLVQCGLFPSHMGQHTQAAVAD